MRYLLFIICFCLASNATAQINVQEVRAANGLTAWLVEDHSSPLINFNMAWRGGVADEEKSQSGITALMAQLLTQGAGAYETADFATRLANTATDISFYATRDAIIGRMQCLQNFAAQCFTYLRAAISAPHFDAAALTRARAQAAAALKQQTQNPTHLAAQNLYRLAFGEHRLGEPIEGTAASLANITRARLQARHKQIIARDNLVLAVAGAITPATLRAVMNSVFADLPAEAKLTPTKPPTITQTTTRLHIPRGGGQTHIAFATRGIARTDPEFFAAFAANHILGGGGFSSKLVEEVRNKRGLAYSVYARLANNDYSSLWQGAVASRDANAAEALEIIKEEMRKMRAGEISQTELDDAKSYLIGSYALRFDSGAKISRALLHTQLDRRPITYFTDRNKIIAAISLEQVKAAAARLFAPDELLISSVGGILSP